MQIEELIVSIYFIRDGPNTISGFLGGLGEEKIEKIYFLETKFALSANNAFRLTLGEGQYYLFAPVKDRIKDMVHVVFCRKSAQRIHVSLCSEKTLQ